MAKTDVRDKAADIRVPEGDAGAGDRLSELTERTFRAPDLNRIVETIRRNQERDVEDPAKPSDQLWTNPEGEILTGTVVDPRTARGLSRITQETFYAPDLNRIVETIQRNQERDVEDPAKPSDQLWTNPEGEILHRHGG